MSLFCCRCKKGDILDNNAAKQQPVWYQAAISVPHPLKSGSRLLWEWAVPVKMYSGFAESRFAPTVSLHTVKTVSPMPCSGSRTTPTLPTYTAFPALSCPARCSVPAARTPNRWIGEKVRHCGGRGEAEESSMWKCENDETQYERERKRDRGKETLMLEVEEAFFFFFFWKCIYFQAVARMWVSESASWALVSQQHVGACHHRHHRDSYKFTTAAD